MTVEPNKNKGQAGDETFQDDLDTVDESGSMGAYDEA
jgi:hypothetical protein